MRLFLNGEEWTPEEELIVRFEDERIEAVQRAGWIFHAFCEGEELDIDEAADGHVDVCAEKTGVFTVATEPVSEYQTLNATLYQSEAAAMAQPAPQGPKKAAAATRGAMKAAPAAPTITVSGLLPLGVYAVAWPVDVKVGDDQEVVVAYEILVRGVLGVLWDTRGLRVEITVPGLDADVAGEGLSVLSIDGFDTRRIEYDKIENGVSFATDGSPIYALVKTTSVREISAEDGSTWRVKVTYAPGATGIPADAALAVDEILPGTEEYEKYVFQSEDELGKPLDDAKILDVRIVDPEDATRIYEPAEGTTVKVSIELTKKPEYYENATAYIVHIGENGAEEWTATAGLVDGGYAYAFTAGSLSPVVVGYTVDFHWGEYTYNLAGGSEIYLSELLRVLGGSGTEADEDSRRLLKLAEHMNWVENAQFSNPELVKIEQKASEQAENDWLLASLAPFDTEETLTIALTDGSEIVIRVTDESAIARVSNDNGATWKKFEYLINSGTDEGGVLLGAFDYANTLSGGVIIETLKENDERYTLTSGFTFSNNNITNLTIRTANGVGRSTLTKTHTAPMITFSITNAPLTVENLVLLGGETAKVTVSGGAIRQTSTGANSGLTLRNVDFGALNGETADMSKAFVSTTRGGAVYTSVNTNITVEDCGFYGCKAYCGAGLYYDKGNVNAFTVTFRRTQFIDCLVTNEYGAAFSGWYNSGNPAALKTTIEDCVFKNCISNASYSGAAIIRTVNLDVINSTFENCYSTSGGHGGALWVSTNGKGILNFTGTSFKDCYATGNGGAFAMEGSPAQLNVSGCSFTNCGVDGSGTVKSDNGGAIYSNAAATSITDSTFANCKCRSIGGAVYSSNKLEMTASAGASCVFSGCSSTGKEGGAIHVNGGSMTVTNNAGGTIRFENCQATAADGGAISTDSRPLTINNSGTISFNGCTGKTGGAICTHQDTSVTIHNEAGAALAFENCTGIEKAGAIWTGDFKAENNKGAIRFENCEAQGISTGDGGAGAGAVYTGKSFTLTNADAGTAEFVNCSATKANANGGAIVLNNKYSGTGKVILSGTAANPVSFTNCSAPYGFGGAIYHENNAGQMALSHVTMTGNSAKQGGAVYSASKDIQLRNSVSITGGALTGTDVNNGGGIYLKDDEAVITIESDTGTADITVNGNKTSDNKNSNIYTGRLVPPFEITAGSVTGRIGVANPDSSGRWFGRSTGQKVCGEDDILKNVFLDDAGALTAAYGGNGYRLYWNDDQAGNVCKITDADGNLLNYNGEAAVFMSLAEAFGAFEEAVDHPERFTDESGTQTTPRNIEMFVENHTQDVILRVPNLPLTLKTAAAGTGAYDYPADAANSKCVITRATFANSMFIMDANDDFTIENITIDGNNVVSGYNGGILRASGTGSKLTLSGATLKNGKTSQNGGALYLEDGVSFAMSGSEISGCSAGVSGGGIYLAGKNGAANITGSIFTGCTLTNTDTGNNTNGSGGAIYSDGRNLNVTGCAFTNDKASKRGGAIAYYGEGSTTLTVKGSIFTGCETTLNTTSSGTCFGGGIFINNGRLVINDNEGTRSRFENCHSNRYGGAVMLYGSGAQTIEHTDFVGCNCNVNNGGAYYTESSGALSFTDCTFTNCAAGSSSGSGGAIYEYSTSESGFTVEACTFEGCKATAGNGGAIYSKRSVTIKDSTIQNGCTAKNGAAVYTEAKNITVDGGRISGNTATAGGAIGVSASESRLTFRGSAVVSGNTMNGSASNIYLNMDTDAIIQADGLTDAANIGVYVTDNYLGRYGQAGRTFGRYIGEAENLDRFVNDREPGAQGGELRGTAFAGNKVAWQGENLVLTVLDGGDDTTPVVGARFTIERVSWDDRITKIFSGVTDENGQVIIPWQSGSLPGEDPAITGDGGGCAFVWGEKYVLRETETQEGYALPGGCWDITIEGAGGVTPAARQVPNQNQTPDIEKESLFAWKTQNYAGLTITYDLQEGTWAEKPAQITETSGTYTQMVQFNGTSATIPEAAPVKDGFILAAWNNKADGTGDVTYQPGDTIRSSTAPAITLYAIWVEHKYVARVIASDGTITYHEALVSNDNATYNGRTVKKGAFTYANTLAGNVVIETLKTAPGTNGGVNESDAYILGSGSSVGFTFNKSGQNLTIRTMPGLGFTSTIRKNTTNSLISVTSPSSLAVENLIFDGNSANRVGNTSGGIFYITSSRAVFTDCTFRDCLLSAKNGSAICYSYNKGNGILEIYGCTFDNCQSPTSTASSNSCGGAVTVDVDTATTVIVDRSEKKSRTQFINCVARRYGGAMWLEPNSGSVSIRHTDFIRCKANTNNNGGVGGGFGTDTYDLTVVDCRFEDCTCGYDGGGGFYQRTGNDASYTVRVSQSEFVRCSGKNGGGCYITNAKAQIIDSGFTGCQATNGSGGGVYAAGAVTVEGSTKGAAVFDTCSATGSGGGVYAAGVPSKIVNAAFVDNSANGSGGSVYIVGKDSNQSSEIRNCSFDGHENLDGTTLNAGTNGGAVYIGDGYHQIYDCEFKDATAGNEGGLVYAYPGMNDQVDMQRCSFNGHDTLDAGIKNAKTGGGLFIRVATGSVKDTVFDDCSADNGGAMYAYTAITAENISATDCSATENGGAMYFNEGGTINNVSINGHQELDSTVPNAALGGAIWLANNRALNITGGNIQNCSASAENGGAINVGGTGSVLNFAGSAMVFNNPSGAEGTQQKNVVLDQNSNAIIRTTADGLSPDACIGVYATDEQNAAHGMISMPFGTWVSEQNLTGFVNDRDNTLNGTTHSNTDNKVYWGKIICKVVDGENQEHPFTTLNSAVSFVRSDLGGTGTVQMLCDYTVLEFDKVTLNQASDNITFTTAHTEATKEAWEQYVFEDTLEGKAETGTAVLTRGWNGAGTAEQAIFYLNNASVKLTTTDIILDGKNGSTQQTGRVEYINAGSMSIQSGTTIRNIETPGHGGAIYATANVKVDMDNNSGTIVFRNSYTTGNNQDGGAIYVNGNMTALNNTGTILFDNCRTDSTGDQGGALFALNGLIDLECGGNGQILFKDCYVRSADSSYGGGAVCGWNNTEIKLIGAQPDSIHFENCRVMAGGGGGAVKGAKVTLENVTFGDPTADGAKKCFATGGNGGAVAATGELSVKNCKFYGSTSSGTGGAIFQTSANNVTVTDSEFTDCVGTNGSGVYIDTQTTARDVSFERCNFTGCNSTNGYGAICFATADSVRAANTTVKECTFTDCKSTDWAGALILRSTHAVLEDCDFIRCCGNTTGSEGSNACSVYIKTYNTSGTVKVVRCSFDNGGKGKKNGGALHLDSQVATLNIEGCEFENAKSASNGGAVYAYATNTTVENTSFTNCTATSNGGGVYATGTLTVNNNSFDGCEAVNGGGVYGNNTVALNGGSITNCTATTNGGGVYANGALTVTGGSVDGCEAANGGGVYGNSTVALNGGSIENCTATTNGGGVYAAGALTVTGCSFDRCEAANGGGVYGNSTVALNDGSTTNCTAASNGGGVYANSTLTMSGSSFDGCAANADGGAVYAKANATLSASEIKNSRAAGLGGAVYLAGGSMTLTDTTVTGNRAEGANGGAVNCANNTKLYFEGTTQVHGNHPSAGSGQRNVVLSQDNLTTINVTANGLSEDALIGIYAIDDNSIFENHGGLGDDFGSRPTEITENLDRFVNDRNTLVGGEGSTDMTIAWVIAYKLVLDPNGGDGDVVSVNLTTYKEYTLSNPYTKEGWHFEGWNTRKDGTGVAYTANDVVSHLTDEEGATVTLYAQWADYIPCVITFHPNGGEEIPSREVKPGTKLGLLPSTVRDHYTFTGWKLIDEDGQEVPYTAETEVNTDLDFYATWQKKVLITFDPGEVTDDDGNPVSGIVGEKTREITPGRVGSLPRAAMPAVTQRDFQFAGWFYTDANGEKQQATADTAFTRDTTLTAEWQVWKRRLIYDFNRDGGNGTTTVSDLYGPMIEDIQVIRHYRFADSTDVNAQPAGFPTVENHGYELIGWFTEKSGGNQIKAGDKIDLRVQNVIHAHWKQILPLLEVNFDLNGGTLGGNTSIDPITTKDPDKPKRPLFLGDAIEGFFPTGTPVKEGKADLDNDGTEEDVSYPFLGWYLMNGTGFVQTGDPAENVKIDRTTKIDENIISLSGGTVPAEVTEGTGVSITLKAKWGDPVEKPKDPEPEYVTVTFYGNGLEKADGTEYSTSRRILKGRSVRNIPGPARAGYILEGWYPERDGTGEKLTADKTFDADVAYYAHWTPSTETPDDSGYHYSFSVIWTNPSTETLTNEEDHLTWFVNGNGSGNAVANAKIRFWNDHNTGGVLPAESVQIKIPKYAFESAPGQAITSGYTNAIIQIPQYPYRRPGYDWSYKDEGDYYILINTSPLQTGEFGLDFYYRAPMAQVNACRIDSKSGEVIDEHGNPIANTYQPRENVFTVTVDHGDGNIKEYTRSLYTGMYKYYSYDVAYRAGRADGPYTTWDTAWGEKPSDADQYYYIKWNHGYFDGNGVSNGLFSSTAQDKTWAPDSYEQVYPADGEPSNYVITKHKYADLVNGRATHTKQETVSGTWSRQGMVGQTETGTATLKIDVDFYKYASEGGSSRYGTVTELSAGKSSNWIATQTQQTGQDMLLDDQTISASFSLGMTGPGGSSDPAVEDHIERQQDSNLFYAREYTMIMRDGDPGDILYHSTVQKKDIRLGDNDYSFTGLSVSLSNEDGYWHQDGTDSGGWIGSANTSYSSWEPVEVWIRKAGETEYTKYTDITFTNGSSKWISLPANTVGFEIRYTTIYWETRLYVYPTVRINPTDHVQELVRADYEELEVSVFKNTAHFRDVSAETGETLTLSNSDSTPASWTQSASFSIGKGKTRLNVSKSTGGATGDVLQGIQSVPISVTGANQNSAGFVKPITSGIFYELLPRDGMVDESSVYVNAGGVLSNSMVHVEMVPNWCDNRTMMIVTFSVPETVKTGSVSMGYTLKNTYENIQARGADLFGQSAFVNTSVHKEPYDWSPNKTSKITAEGLKEGNLDGTKIFGSKAADPAHNLEGKYGDYIAYAWATAHFEPINTYSMGFHKLVSTQSSYEETASVIVNNEYTYRLMLTQSHGNASDSIVFYDVLEAGEGTEWQGTLLSVDVSGIGAVKGENGEKCAPVVYYSTKARDSFTEPDDFDLKATYDEDGTTTSVWTPVKPAAEKITAIAVDCTKTASGSTFVAKDDVALGVYIRMKAPADKTLADKIAVNEGRVYARDASNDLNPVVERDGGKTTVTLLIPHPEISLSADPDLSPSTETNPKLVAYKDTIVYDIAVTNPVSEDAKKNFTYRDVIVTDTLPDEVSVERNDIRVYTDNPDRYAKLEKDGNVWDSPRVRMTVDADGQYTFTVKSLMPGETLHIQIPTIVNTRESVDANGDPAPFSNQAKLTEACGMQEDPALETVTVWHQVKKYEVNFGKRILGTETRDENDAVTAVGTWLAGACLQLTDSSGEAVEADWTWTTQTLTEGQDARYKTLRLGADEYTLTELNPPDHYAAAEPIHFTVSREGEITIRRAETVSGKTVVRQVPLKEIFKWQENESSAYIDMYDKWVDVDAVITNTVKGQYAEAGKEFDYTAQITGLTKNKTYAYVKKAKDGTETEQTFTASNEGVGTQTFKLKDGEKLTLRDLPTGAKVTVTQTGTEYQTDYTATRPAEDGTTIRLHRGATTRKFQALTTQETRMDVDEGIVTFAFVNEREDGIKVRVIVRDREDDAPIIGSELKVLGPEVTEPDERFSRAWDSDEEYYTVILPPYAATEQTYELTQESVPEQWMPAKPDSLTLTVGAGDALTWTLGAENGTAGDNGGTINDTWTLEKVEEAAIDENGSEIIEVSYKLTIRNPRRAKLKVEDFADNTEWYVAGAKFELWKKTGETAEGTAVTEKVKGWTSTARSGELLYLDLASEYYVTKTATPNKYYEPLQPVGFVPVTITVRVSEDGTVTVGDTVYTNDQGTAVTNHDVAGTIFTAKTETAPANLQFWDHYAKLPSKIVRITNTVEGYKGEQDKDFTYTLNVRLNSGEAEPSYTYNWVKYGANGQETARSSDDSAVSAEQGFRSGSTFTLKHGESIEIDLPIDRVITIAEARGKYHMTASEIVDENAGSGLVKLKEDDAEEVTRIALTPENEPDTLSFTMNDDLNRNPQILVVNDLKLAPLTLRKTAKTQDGKPDTTGTEYEFKLTAVEGGVSGDSYAWVKYSTTGTKIGEGSNLTIGDTFKLKDGERIVIDLPVGQQITVTEAEGDYTMTAEETLRAGETSGLADLNAQSADPDNGSEGEEEVPGEGTGTGNENEENADEDTGSADNAWRIGLQNTTMIFVPEKATEIRVINTLVPAEIPLTITNTVDGAMGDFTKDFTFTVAVADLSDGDKVKITRANDVEAEYTVANGVVTFRLKADESATLMLLRGKQITVTETDAGYYTLSLVGTLEGMDGDVTLSDPDKQLTFKLAEDAESAKLTVKNTLEAVSPTGVNLTYAPFTLMLLFGAVLLLLSKRRKAKN